MNKLKKSSLLFLFITLAFFLKCQSQNTNFWTPADSLDKKRFWYLTGGGALAYTGASIGLYHIWYKDYPLGNFRFFDDWGQWENMDKWGHAFTAYTESYLAYKGARWTGIDHKPAVWIGAGIGTLLQGTIEIMDGFSEEWGFSNYDLAFNTGGVALFTAQELLWQEQRIVLKVSSTRPNYSTELTTNPGTGFSASTRDVANDLYGSSFFEYLVKDYNSMTVWASINPHSFMGKKKETTAFPAWLSVSIGIGADEIFGAYGNIWTDSAGNKLPLPQYTRYKQYYLSLDIDTAKIKTKSPFLKTIFTAIRWIKIPAPTLEWNQGKNLVFHPIYW